MKKYLLFTIVLFLLNIKNMYAQTPLYLNPTAEIDDRVTDLISRMSLEEKVSQMLNAAPAIPRLKIPAYDWWNESLHGVARTPYPVTSYPQAIGMAATFDVDAMKLMGDYTAEEGRAIYNESMRRDDHERYLGLTYWTPNINIFRDSRWGRGQETYGEDPYLTGTMGKAFVTGLQGDDPRYLKAAACAKHFAVHSGPESSRHVFDVSVSNFDLWDTYLPAFKDLVVDAKVAGVMCAYNAFEGQPCCGSDPLMRDILRNQWHFAGYVTSDCGAIDDFYQTHKLFPDAESSAADAVLHGTDLECGNITYKSLVTAVKNGLLSEKDIDVSLKRLFTIRYRLGMFDPEEMVKFSKITTASLESEPHKAHALKMARESIVLLKNESAGNNGQKLLPLSKSIKRIAILGPNADNADTQLGNYNGKPTAVTTVLMGIKEKLPEAEIFYSKANDFVEEDGHDFSKLTDSIGNADVIIYVGGISPRLEGEEMKVTTPGFAGGDRTSILLPSVQTECLKALQATGKPVVFVMMTGSAIAIPWEQDHLPAIINSFYGGQAAGTAIADVLFGDYNPSGRLPVTYYKSDDDLPPFEDYSMENRTYRYFKGEPLYPFGFGLSYTRFEYGEIKLSKSEISKDESVRIEVPVRNVGKAAGDEVVQLYITHLDSGKQHALYTLKGFQRIHLAASASDIVRFGITPEMLQVINESGEAVNVLGEVKISVAGSLPSERSEMLGAVRPASAVLMIR